MPENLIRRDSLSVDALFPHNVKLLSKFSVIKVRETDPAEMILLMKQGNVSDNLCYKINGDLFPTLSRPQRSRIQSVPKHLYVVFSVDFEGFSQLPELPQNFFVGRTLFLKACSSLRTLPENLTVGLSAELNECHSLETLPTNFFVGENLLLNGCTRLKYLPDDLIVRRSLFLNDCYNLQKLPENLSVLATLSLINCTSLRELPNGMNIPENLYLKGCTNLEWLPQTLKVGRNLTLEGCTELRIASDTLLEIGGNLILKDCTNLGELPASIKLGGDLDLSGCVSLTSLLHWITELGWTTENQEVRLRKVYLENTGLPAAILAQLEHEPPEGMQFYVAEPQGVPERTFRTFEEAFTFWAKLAKSRSPIPILDLRPDQMQSLTYYLQRLTGTADYQNRVTQRILAQRVLGVMSLLSSNQEIQENALMRIHHATSTCDDRVILALDDLEALELSRSAEAMAMQPDSDPTELRALGRQMMILDALKVIARRHISTLNYVNPIEVELAFQIGLRKHFNLPGATQYMLFRACSGVSQWHITQAAMEIEQDCTEDALGDFLRTWEPWQKYLRSLSVPAFEQLQHRVVARIRECPFCLDKTEQMVVFDDDHYDYHSLRRAFLENSKDPFFKKPLDWSMVCRLTEKSRDAS
ncbi:NEL-type E3 ubiquitin ligase domain-containing protein [Endozoicomonas sp. GU-1]|uniref:NEL-type E3 ubiquitin ligase domain-containing protein n=1 Tax=Endozoicomonas sp. GU-1 TaxID=3009078 RepID=UPI0022B351F3|nr:NEL-type E3 ubiquitin ligase domain-containing protein [Endozoicomonas sp. GU-1]WBA83512.1 NEL-type E3 ubiquitin ligase domain-containing protein [Endozoicomonas sp. GU-1]